jgi:hypothetical protein
MRMAVTLALALALTSCGASPARQMPGLGGARAEPQSSIGSAPPTPTTTAPEQEILMPGESARVGDWVLRVVSVDVDGTAEVLAHNQFNEPPPDGMQFFLAHLEATYLGDASATMWLELGLTAIGPDGTRFQPFEPSCGVVPDDVDFAGEAFPGGTVTGATCWVVDSGVASDLVMEVVTSGGGLQARTRFSLDPGADPLAGTTVPVELPPLRLDPVAVGEPTDLGGWEVTVVGVDDDAAEAVLAENQFNDPPRQGYRYVVVELSARRTADTAGSFTAEVGAKPVGAARRVAYEGLAGSCGVIPDPISDQVETPPGAVATGALCWQVAEEDLSSLVVVLSEFATGARTQLAASRR